MESNTAIAQKGKQVPNGVRKSLQLAGDNLPELEKVIKYYSKKPEDVLKLRAAYFLIDNMKWHKYNAVSIVPDSGFLCVFNMADSMYYEVIKHKSTQEIKANAVRDSLTIVKKIIREKLKESNFNEPTIVLPSENTTDLNNIKAAFLIEQIEHAFAIKATSPFVAKLLFDDFCAYTLSYRLIDGQALRVSGKKLNYFFFKYIGDINKGDFSELIARYNATINNLRDILGPYPFKNRTGFEELFFTDVSGFDCFSIAQYGWAALNACGIPVNEEYNIAYKQYQDRHSQCNILKQIGNWTNFSPESGLPIPKTTPYENFDENLGLLNLYEIHFAAQKDAAYFLKQEKEYVPEILADPCIKDVTHNSMYTVSITLPFTANISNNLCYLATFNSASGIIPVAWTTIDKKKKAAVFKYVIPNRLYFPVYYEGSSAVAFGNPFYLKEDTTTNKGYNIISMNNSEPTKDTIMLTLTRKFPRKPNMIQLAKDLMGLTVLGFDSLKGKQDTLYTLNFELQPYMQDIKLNNTKAYRYYKFQAPPTRFGNGISELQLLTDKKYGYTNIYPKTPLPVLYPGHLPSDDSNTVRLLQDDIQKVSKWRECDGNMGTMGGVGSYILYDLHQPQVVTALRLAPLNADNGIVPGNEYQLRYWNAGQWNDFGYPQTAEYNYLAFKDAPKGKLFWLRNLSSGKEELPFMVDEKGKQLFIYYDIR